MPRTSEPDPDFSSLWLPNAVKTSPFGPQNLVADRASGIEILDANGRHFIDPTSSFGSNLHGFRCASVNQAIKNQLHRIADTRFVSTTTGILAERLVALAPTGLSHVVFAPNGTEAVENSIIISIDYQTIQGRAERRKTLRFGSARRAESRTHCGETNTENVFVEHPLSMASFESVFHMHKDHLCAVVVEPRVSWSTGVQLWPPDLLSGISQRCREFDVLLIADESVTGFGRTGPMFACEADRVVPDLLCCGSALTGGHLPLGATLVSEGVFHRVSSNRDTTRPPLQLHQSANPLACAAALASLELFTRDRILAAIPAQAQHLRQALEQFVAHLPGVHTTRQCGMMAGIELKPDSVSSAGNAFDRRVARHAIDAGILLHFCGSTIIVMPPLLIENHALHRLMKGIASAISQATVSAVDTLDLPIAPTRRRRPLRPHGLMLLGTDTNIGKTTVARAILRMAARAGHPVVPVKPTESGCNPTPVDAEALRRASRLDLPLERVCPFPFSAPVAPAIAAEMEDQTLTLDQLVAACNRARPEVKPHQPILVESAGGLLSPLTSTETNADLAAKLGLPILLVARNGLGTINHAALSIGELRRRGLPIAALVLVDTDGKDTPDRKDNARAIERLTGIAPIGTFPYFPGNAPMDEDEDDALALALEKSCDTSPIWHALAPDS